MLPEYDIHDRVEAVKCLGCGDRRYRDLQRRTPTVAERNTKKAAAKKRRFNHV